MPRYESRPMRFYLPDHQLCVAHLELLFFEQKQNSQWSSNFKKMLYDILELKKVIPRNAYNASLKTRAEMETRLLNLLQKIVP